MGMLMPEVFFFLISGEDATFIAARSA